MNVSELQLQLHQVIDSITDNEKLEAIYTLLKGAKGPHDPMSLEEYVGAIDEAKQQLQDGRFQAIDELEKESENW